MKLAIQRVAQEYNGKRGLIIHHKLWDMKCSRTFFTLRM